MTKIRWIVFICIAAAVALALFFLLKGAQQTPLVAPGFAGMPKRVPVQAVVLTPVAFEETIAIPGSIVANEEVTVVLEIGGRITSIGFAEGGRVAKGQVLATVFDADVRARLERARHQYRLDNDKLQRLKKLEPVDGVSAQDLDAATATAAIRQAEVDELEAILSRYTIRAPFGGIAGLRSHAAGAVVAPQTPLTTLRDDSSLKLEFSLPERYGALVQPGTNVQFNVRSAAGTQSHTAIVYAVDPGVDAQTRSMRVRANVRRSPGLVSGMYADVAFRLDADMKAVAVPSEAVVPDINGTSVFVVRNGSALKTLVDIGGRSTTHARIVSGLRHGDTVITSGLLQLRNGLAVEATVVTE